MGCGMRWRVCSGVQGDAGAGCGGPGGVAPWLARGPQKAGLAASYIYILQERKQNMNKLTWAQILHLCKNKTNNYLFEKSYPIRYNY